MREIEKTAITETLKSVGNDRRLAAKILQIGLKFFIGKSRNIRKMINFAYCAVLRMLFDESVKVSSGALISFLDIWYLSQPKSFNPWL